MTDFVSPAIPFCKKLRDCADNNISYSFNCDGLNVEIFSKIIGDDFWQNEQTEKIYYSFDDGSLTYARMTNMEINETDSFFISKNLFDLLRDTDYVLFSHLQKCGRKMFICRYKAQKQDLVRNAMEFNLPLLKAVILVKASDFTTVKGIWNGRKKKKK